MNKIVIIALLISTLFSKMPDAVSQNGMVVSSNAIASQIGAQVLRDGGNAVDAAVAVGFALAVVHPGAGNIGGGGFMVVRFADGTATTIDFREVAPLASSKDMFLDENGEVISGKSWNTSYAVGVPGTVAGLGYVHEKYGSKRWSSLIAPSIKVARYGHEIDYLNYMLLNSPYYKNFLSNDPETRSIFTKAEGYQVGDLLIQKDLANTLSRISSFGYKEFYEGKTADMIIDCMDRTNGLITHLDLINYRPVERDPIEFYYHDNKVITMPPASSGGIVLAEILNQLETIDLSSISYHSADHIHYMSEIEKRAYADRAEVLGDMDFIEIPIDTLIGDAYAAFKASDIDCCKASNSEDIIPFKTMNTEKEETTHYSVVDKWGNAVSVTTTVNGWYGSGITVDNAGFLLNNEMDDFSIKPGYPNKYGLVGSWANSIAPNKRMLSSMSPSIIEDEEGDLFLVVGSPGGSTIITTVAQIISNVIDYNMSLKDAVESPRTHHQWLPDKITIEDSRFSPHVIDKLEEYGHDIGIKRSIGEANCIMYDKKLNLFYGVSDDRRNGQAVGY
ncbi:MAG: gamma-glutamyltransferase [Candidatus Marinimicrobia bacterium]|nr:gamma-glutamyltransferase [Candidatus Neomarinimicrobiota bacterium]|tara:strand:- start:2951 stop:4630 length:1680 start_codon:yes stop_codon:yes gene_type:complete